MMYKQVVIFSVFFINYISSYYYRTTEIRDFERSEEIPLQLLVILDFYFLIMCSTFPFSFAIKYDPSGRVDFNISISASSGILD